MSKIEYKNSVPLDAGLTIVSDDFEEAIAQIYSELRSTGKFVRSHSRFTDALRTVVANVFNASSIDPDMAVGYSRNKTWYSTSLLNMEVGLRYDAMVRVVDSLARDCGYLELKKGYWDKKSKKGHSARMRATPKLMGLLCATHGVDLQDVRRKRIGDIIIQKDKDKKSIGFDDTSDVIRMRGNLEIINAMINSKFIGLAVFDETIEEINGELASKLDEDGEYRKVLDFTRRSLTRIFNNSSFQEGGRFYNGWWQEIPNRFRKFIRIDDMGVEEVDFSGLHINMLYLEEGLSLPVEDVYMLKGIPDESRTMLKIALQIILNSPTKNTATRKIKHEYPESSDPELFSKFSHSKIIKAFRKKHYQIEKYFYKGHGVKLQFIDSEIAEDILLCLAAKGIVALPVHDSFLVQRIHLKELIETMKEATLRRYLQILKVKKDPSAYEENKVLIAQEVMEEDVPQTVEEYERSWTSAKEYPAYLTRMQMWHQDQRNSRPPG